MEKVLEVKRERSAAYPAISIDQAIDFSIILEKSFGKTPFSREGAVQAMGYKAVTGTSGSRVAALVHYGLVQRDGNSYQNSNLTIRIVRPIDDADKKEAIQEAVKSPKLFDSLIKAYVGQALPSALDNILIHRYKITKNVAKDVANTFRRSLESSGLLQNGIVTDMVKNEAVVVQELPVNLNNTLPLQSVARAASSMSEMKDMQKIVLPSGIVIFYPEKLSYSFAVGEFGQQIKALEDAVSKAEKRSLDN